MWVLHDGVWTAEISTLGAIGRVRNGIVELPQGKSVAIRDMTPDYDASGEDIGGWKYTDPSDGQKYLLIND